MFRNRCLVAGAERTQLLASYFHHSRHNRPGSNSNGIFFHTWCTRGSHRKRRTYISVVDGKKVLSWVIRTFGCQRVRSGLQFTEKQVKISWFRRRPVCSKQTTRFHHGNSCKHLYTVDGDQYNHSTFGYINGHCVPISFFVFQPDSELDSSPAYNSGDILRGKEGWKEDFVLVVWSYFGSVKLSYCYRLHIQHKCTNHNLFVRVHVDFQFVVHTN